MSKHFRRGVGAVAVLTGSLAFVSGTGVPPAGAVSGPLCSSVAWVAAGQTHAFAVKSDGTVWGFGNNSRNQLAGGALTNHTAPVQSDDLRGVTALAAGAQFTVAVFPGGGVRTIGANNYGQLGNGTLTESKFLVTPPGLPAIKAVDTGGYHTVALANDGTVWSWGRNSEGETGQPVSISQKTPVQVAGLSNVVAVAAGWFHSLALKSDGTVWAWGYNADGQLGNGTRTTTNVPVQVSGLSNVVAIDGGVNFSLARQADGTLKGWGGASQGQLGVPSTGAKTTPMTIPLAGVAEMAAGSYFALARTTDGKTYSWGSNASGQIGMGEPPPTTPRPDKVTSPTEIPAGGASMLAAGDKSAYAVRSGTLWGWGENSNGQLGNGTTTDAVSPAQSGCPNGAVLPWSLALVADPPAASPGLPVTLTAVTNQDVGNTPYAIQIFDKQSGVLLRSCGSGTTCSAVTTSPTPGSFVYAAYIATPSVTAPPPFVQAGSETTVRWGKLGPGPYSESCEPGAKDVFVGQSLGHHVMIKVKEVSSNETWVCFRYNDEDNWVGGRVSIVAPSIAAPTITVDEQANACARGDNLAPGPHPLVNQGIGMVDTYARANEAAVCLRIGDVSRRVGVASSLPSALSASIDGL